MDNIYVVQTLKFGGFFITGRIKVFYDSLPQLGERIELPYYDSGYEARVAKILTEKTDRNIKNISIIMNDFSETYSIDELKLQGALFEVHEWEIIEKNIDYSDSRYKLGLK